MAHNRSFIVALLFLALLALVGAGPLPGDASQLSRRSSNDGFQQMSPEAICQLEPFRLTHENLVDSGAINFYSDWSRDRTDDPGHSEPEEFAFEMLHDDHLSCRLTDNGCKPSLTCPQIVKWMSPDGKIDDLETIRRVYFVYVALDRIFENWHHNLEEARLTSLALGQSGIEFASRFYPQPSEAAKKKCEARKFWTRTAILTAIDTVTIFIGSASGGPLGAAIAVPGLKLFMNALASGITNAGMGLLRTPIEANFNRRMDNTDSGCSFPLFKNALIDDEAKFNEQVGEVTENFRRTITGFFDDAALGINKIPGNASQLALFLKSQQDTLFTPSDPLKTNLDESGRFQANWIQLMVSPIVANAWRTQSCYLHCTPVPAGTCPVHENSPIDGLEFCSDGKFCQAACWAPGKHSYRLYPLWGWLKQSSEGAEDAVWTDEGGQRFARAEQELMQWPWNLDIRKSLKISHELSDSPSPALDEDLVIERRLGESDVPTLRLSTCQNVWLEGLPDYTGIRHKQYKHYGELLFPCACGDDFGSQTLEFYTTTFSGVSDMQCYEKGTINKDPIADMCSGQLDHRQRPGKSITAEYLANCNHVVARMTVRSPKAGRPKPDICDAKTQWARDLRAQGVSDKDMDAQFCQLDFGPKSSNAPWGHSASLAYENKLVLRSMRDTVLRIMKRCEDEFGSRKQRHHWAHKMHFMNDDYSCHW